MKRLDASLEDKRLLRQVRREGAALLRGIRDMERKLAGLRRGFWRDSLNLVGKEEIMERVFDAVRMIQRYTDLSVSANQAQYGLEYCLQGDFGEDTKSYLQGGMALCRLLKEGSEVSSLAQISPTQLGILDIFKPIKERGEELGDVKTQSEKAIQLLEGILEAAEKRERPSSEDVEYLQDFFGKIEEPYLETAFLLIEAMRAQVIPSRLKPGACSSPIKRRPRVAG